jgi:hypothetical protein
LINAAAVAGGAWFGRGASREAAKLPKTLLKYREVFDNG